MQLAELSVEGLFGRFDHTLPLPTSSEDSTSPSVVIIHGPNGIGKTTLLQMLDGIMRLDFDTFRRVPFARAILTFSTADTITIARVHEPSSIGVRFREHNVFLHPEEKGALLPDDAPAVNRMREEFQQFTSEISFEFLDESRIIRRLPWQVDSSPDSSAQMRFPHLFADFQDPEMRHRGRVRRPPEGTSLGDKIRRFSREAQVDYRQFFSSTEPDLFPKIIDNLSNPSNSLEKPDALEKKLQRVLELEETQARLGLFRDRWDYNQLITAVRKQKNAEDNNHALVVLNTYTEFLESRAEARQLVAERLLTFEEVMREFFEDKTVEVNRKSGIEIKTREGVLLRESQLSSGEYQLLYLMVSALTTRRRGTVIAIDEPELSIHTAWQRKLVRNILKCASRATPQLIIATHSPEIAADYSERLVRISPDGKNATT